MVLKTESEARNLSRLLGNQVTFGGVLRNKCRSIFYYKGIQESDRNADLVYPISSSCGDEDQTFDAVERKSEEKPQHTVEIPFSRVVATHKYCFLCGLTKSLKTVPFETRQ